jgi:hypothetical protein
VGEEKQRAVFNMRSPSPEPLMSITEIRPPEVERSQEVMRTAALGWRTETMAVDVVRDLFETWDLGNDFWVAVAPLADCVLILSSRGVGRPDFALVRVTEDAE